MVKRASILIVDDNVSMGRTMSLILERKGYVVVAAKSGPDAIERIKERPFEVAFIDIKMPVMDGVDTYKRIKAIRPESAVIMMTGYGVEDLVAAALREGACGIVYKPLDIEGVLALIERVRRNKQGALILVVDDDPGICLTFKNILMKMGHRVSTASDGREAVSVAREEPDDIIFIDMKLPTINGLETYLAIKEINPHAVVVMMTAYRYEMADLVQMALNNHAYACLYKPLDMAAVLRLIDEILASRQEVIR